MKKFITDYVSKYGNTTIETVGTSLSYATDILFTKGILVVVTPYTDYNLLLFDIDCIPDKIEQLRTFRTVCRFIDNLEEDFAVNSVPDRFKQLYIKQGDTYVWRRR